MFFCFVARGCALVCNILKHRNNIWKAKFPKLSNIPAAIKMILFVGVRVAINVYSFLLISTSVNFTPFLALVQEESYEVIADTRNCQSFLSPRPNIQLLRKISCLVINFRDFPCCLSSRTLPLVCLPIKIPIALGVFLFPKQARSENDSHE